MLREAWARCGPGPDVARFRTRVAARESDRAALDEEGAGLGGRATADVASVAERRAEAEERAGEVARVGAKGAARDERITFSKSSLLYKNYGIKYVIVQTMRI